ncbi:MAG: hypothetical protein DRN81_02995 [Thermoproteota archaeon]|nr:MAG: hypothetical protein DRN81_02995 [Candidatus Korarchaeota archaeon]
MSNKSHDIVLNELLIKEVESSLLRMECRGHQNTLYFYKLWEKLELIKVGHEYKVEAVTEETIKEVGALFAKISRNWGKDVK